MESSGGCRQRAQTFTLGYGETFPLASGGPRRSSCLCLWRWSTRSLGLTHLGAGGWTRDLQSLSGHNPARPGASQGRATTASPRAASPGHCPPAPCVAEGLPSDAHPVMPTQSCPPSNSYPVIPTQWYPPSDGRPATLTQRCPAGDAHPVIPTQSFPLSNAHPVMPTHNGHPVIPTSDACPAMPTQ